MNRILPGKSAPRGTQSRHFDLFLAGTTKRQTTNQVVEPQIMKMKMHDCTVVVVQINRFCAVCQTFQTVILR